MFRIPNLGCKNQELGSIIINSRICYVLFKEVNREVKGKKNRESYFVTSLTFILKKKV